MKTPLQKEKVPGVRGQAIVEFALVLMILMVVLVGILEVGRLIFFYAAVNNASREAARYASAIGLDTDPDTGHTAEKYRFCSMIEKMARRSAFFTPLTVAITYDHGPNTSSFGSCTADPNGVDTSISVNSGTNLDRVYVTVSANYSPMLTLIPIGSRTITSASARSIFGYQDLEDLPTRTPTPPTVGVPTTPGTVIPSDTPTATATATVASATPTGTFAGEVVTMTPLPSSTPTLVPSSTATSTTTLTATSTATATGTSTASSSCNTITAGNISVVNNTNTISLTITNPYTDVTVSSILLTWNNNGATGNPKTLTLDRANLGTAYWSGLNNSSGTITLTPASALTLPGNNASSKITFTFVQNYSASSMSGNTTITINFSTPGCNAITQTAN